ncbi:MAG: outer membrane lipoprotein-sorting protein [Deltaproteobacteria bacterium]|nr:outer membrane lipoprotein-sorting protein [Deltaproteobacteria bacterium]
MTARPHAHLARAALVAALTLSALAPAAARADAPPAPKDLLAGADRARGGVDGGLTWTVEVTSEEDGDQSTRTYRVKARGDDALAEVTAPARKAGEILLFNDRNLWFVKPGLRRPVSLSTRQKLSGMASNGDIATTRYARDYDGTIAGEEQVGGEAAWRLDLVAKAKSVTYDRIRYWIAKGSGLALKAEFLTVSGEVFKTATFEYGAKLALDGHDVPLVSKMVIRDQAGGATTTLVFKDAKAESHAPSLFNVNAIVR